MKRLSQRKQNPALPILAEARATISVGLVSVVFFANWRLRSLVATDVDAENMSFVGLDKIGSYDGAALKKSVVVVTSGGEAKDAYEAYRAVGLIRIPFLHIEAHIIGLDIVRLVSDAAIFADRYTVSVAEVGFRRVGLHRPYDVTLIVPIYGVADHVERCARSLKDQTFSGRAQILFIDDGSWDNSVEIINSVICDSPHMKVVAKENGGAASARNFGLEIAEGEYVGFVDGDDYVSSDYLDCLYRAAINNDCDIAQASFAYVNASSGEVTRHQEWLNLERGYLQDVSSRPYGMMVQTPGIWRRLYLRRLLMAQGIRFNESLRRHDDLPFNIEVLSKAQKIAVSSRLVYFYILGREGQDVGATDERMFIHFRIFDYTLKCISSRLWDYEYHGVLLITLFGHHLWAYERIDPGLKPEYLRGMMSQAFRSPGPIGLYGRCRILFGHFRDHRALLLRGLAQFLFERERPLPCDPH